MRIVLTRDRLGIPLEVDDPISLLGDVDQMPPRIGKGIAIYCEVKTKLF